MKKDLNLINKFIFTLSSLLKKIDNLIKIHHKKNIIFIDTLINKHNNIKDEFNPLIKEKSLKNAELLWTLNYFHKIDTNLSCEIKESELKNKHMHKKLEILSELIINK